MEFCDGHSDLVFVWAQTKYTVACFFLASSQYQIALLCGWCSVKVLLFMEGQLADVDRPVASCQRLLFCFPEFLGTMNVKTTI